MGKPGQTTHLLHIQPSCSGEKKSIFRQRFYLLIMLSLLCFGCEEKDEKERCDFNDPLTDLPWLKEIIGEFEGDEKTHARIYQCTYKDGTGFLLEACVGCPDFGSELINCKGERLCILWGLAGESCSEYEVNFENIKLIWEIK